MDFSETYGCVFQSEVQSGFFDRNQVTIHPMMIYYKIKEEENKETLVNHAILTLEYAAIIFTEIHDHGN
jgi:hypothetical protein